MWSDKGNKHLGFSVCSSTVKNMIFPWWCRRGFMHKGHTGGRSPVSHTAEVQLCKPFMSLYQILKKQLNYLTGKVWPFLPRQGRGGGNENSWLFCLLGSSINTESSEMQISHSLIFCQVSSTLSFPLFSWELKTTHSSWKPLGELSSEVL